MDRAATPWLIRRFVDPDAEFLFADQADASLVPDGVTPFGLPGVELSSHDAQGTCFRKVMDRYQLDDRALDLMERILAWGVAQATGSEPPAGLTDEQSTLGTSLHLLGLGLGVAFDDDQHLEVATGVYEGVYAFCQIQTLPAEVRAGTPPHPAERVPYLRQAVGRA